MRPKTPRSKSIAVKTEVPIQVLLEEGRTEAERSPWEELSYSPYTPPHHHRPCIQYPYLSISSYWPDTLALMKDRILHQR